MKCFCWAYLRVVAFFGHMLEYVEISLVGLFGLGMKAGSFKNWSSYTSITKNVQQCITICHFIFSGVAVICIFIHHSSHNLVNIHLVDILQKSPHNTSLLFTVDTVSYWNRKQTLDMYLLWLISIHIHRKKTLIIFLFCISVLDKFAFASSVWICECDTIIKGALVWPQGGWSFENIT